MTAENQLFEISRVFNAPRELVFRCFTDPQHMQHWWGPKGVKVLHSKMDLRVGGTYHYGMQTPDGSVMWGKFVYREVTPPERVVFINSFSDENGGITRHPLMAEWPREMRSEVLFDDLGDGRTRFTVRWSPHNATPAEQEVFGTNHASMKGGWTGTLDSLEAYLKDMQQGKG